MPGVATLKKSKEVKPTFDDNVVIQKLWETIPKPIYDKIVCHHLRSDLRPVEDDGEAKVLVSRYRINTYLKNDSGYGSHMVSTHFVIAQGLNGKIELNVLPD